MLKNVCRVMLLAAALATALPLSAQFGNNIRKANKEYELHAFNRAIESYLEYLERKPNDPEAMAHLADCYRHLNRMEEAAQWYSRVANDRKLDPVHLLRYGLVLKALQDYDQARIIFQRYAQENPAQGNHYAETSSFAKAQTANTSPYLVVNEMINTASAEFGPVFYGNRVAFSSSRVDILQSRTDFSSRPSNQLFVADIADNGFLSTPRFLREDFDATFSEGPVSFSPDGRSVAYTRNNFVDGTRHIPSSGMALSLFFADVNPGGDWMNEKPFPYNGSDFSTGFPCYSPDGNAVYFASDRPDGFGGYDIYVVYRMGNTWSSPENLGPVINSPGNEITPFFDGNSLYFSSDWHAGLGGYDIFRAEQSNGRYGRIVHLGAGVNSSRDDYGFIYDGFRNMGYLTSNREGGKGREDIYKVFKSADNISLKVINAADGQPIPNAVVDFSACAEGVYRTDRNGVYSFQAVEGLNCALVISGEGFKSTTFQVSTLGLRQNRDYNVTLIRDGDEYYGNVVDYQTNRPLEGTLIYVTNQRTGSSQETRTGENGNYTLALDPQSTYVVRYSRAGYRDVNRTVRLEDPTNRTMLGTVSMAPSDMNIGLSGPALINAPDNAAAGEEAATVSRGYAVQVAAGSRPDLSTYRRLESLGTLYAKEEDGLYKIRVGIFSDRSEARAALQSVKKQGFAGSFIVEEGGGAVSSMDRRGPAESTVNTATTGSLGRYMVQLGAYSNTRFFDGTAVEDYGVIEERRKGRLVIKLLAGYDTLSEAQRALSLARSQGFPDAYIVTEENGVLRKVQ